MDELIKKYAMLSEDVMKLFKLASLLSAVFGALLAMLYFLKITYFPVGLTVGDTLFFIAVAIVFGFIYFVFVALIAYSLVTPLRVLMFLRGLMHKDKYINNKLSFDGVLLNIMSLGIGAVLLYVSYLYSNLEAMIQTMLVMLVLYAVYQGVENKSKVFVKPLFLSLIILCPVLFAGVFGSLLNIVMERVGVKINGATVFINKDASETLIRELKEKQLTYKVNDKCNKQCVFSDVNVAFTGVGVNTVLAFRDKDKNIYNFPVKNTQLSLMYQQ